MRHALLLAALGLTSGLAAAQTGDPLDTPRCRQALQQLDRQEAAASATARHGDEAPDPAQPAPRSPPHGVTPHRPA